MKCILIYPVIGFWFIRFGFCFTLVSGPSIGNASQVNTAQQVHLHSCCFSCCSNVRVGVLFLSFFFLFSSLALSLLMTEETFSLKPPQDCRQSCCCCAQQLSCLHQFCHWIRRKSLKVTGDRDISTDDISNKPGQWPPVAVSLASQQLIVAAAGFHLMTSAALIDGDDSDDRDDDEYDDDGDDG